MLLYIRAEIVINRQMQFLNLKGLGLGDTDADVGGVFKLAACFACKPYYLYSKRFSYLYCAENVFGIAQCAYSY